MDWITFISKAIDSLAWPIATMIIVLCLRNPIIALIPLMRKLKYKELELEFSEGVKEIESELVQSGRGESVEAEKVEVEASRFVSLLNISPRAAVLEAWTELEVAAVEIASSFWGRDGESVFKHMPNLGSYLMQCEVFDENQHEAFNKLRQMRNKLAHGEEVNLSREDAKAYIKSALLLTIEILEFNKSSKGAP